MKTIFFILISHDPKLALAIPMRMTPFVTGLDFVCRITGFLQLSILSFHLFCRSISLQNSGVMDNLILAQYCSA